MPRRPKTRSIHISGRRWFSKNLQNTYFTATIYVNGEEIHTLPKEYGYGDYYIQAATEWLHKNKYLPGLKENKWGGTEPLWQYARRKSIKYTATVADVSRERDL